VIHDREDGADDDPEDRRGADHDLPEPAEALVARRLVIDQLRDEALELLEAIVDALRTRLGMLS